MDRVNTLKTGASDLLRDLELLVDGPTRWGNPVPSRAPGIFVIELPARLAEAPIDIVALRRWLEHVPGLTLDGEQPTPEQLAKRLHEFWLPDEPVLFVGRSAKAIGQRVAAILATPLGDARPSSAAHWLNTLSVLPDLRVWWAETDAHEEYEDALLETVAARNGPPALPFANLMDADGHPKEHGLLNSLRSDSDSDGKPMASAGRGANSATRRATVRKPTVRKPMTPRLPKPASRPVSHREASKRSLPEPKFVSREGLDRLAAELDELRTVTRPDVIAKVKSARELGDLRENADYEYARKEQSFVEGRIQMIEQTLRNNVVIERDEARDATHIGSTVVVEVDGDQLTYVIVGSTEADPAAGKLSNASPVGRALIGARAGESVQIDLPSGSSIYLIIEVR